MKDEEINVAIAEICGWRHLVSDAWSQNEGEERYDNCPDYATCLNAMHDAHLYLVSISQPASSRRQPDIRFALHLMDICSPDKKLWDNGKFLGSHFDALKTANATARQRAEAFLRVQGKWVEDHTVG